MSNKSWQERLRAELQQLSETRPLARLAVIGIGHELCGDDAVGVHIASRLHSLLPDDERLLAVEAGPAPENFTGVLRRYKPDLILMIDAAVLDDLPGTVRWLDWKQADGFSASTHTLPIHLVASYLSEELHCEVALIGIQPEQTFADVPLTPLVRKAARKIVRLLVNYVQSQELLSSRN
jgi:hydrogenase 3 maturation protease